ncbi:hypothetical protein [Pseudoalteromonas luteoviolacea]|uniref:Orphan lipoprotein n=1 Tax=Pseudoalteromonas luteoviolacea S4054 TaxID=1129367 RepID=A0A0F6ABZ0_9GAMM|nr:hypothetical protein [Pseudoalteromonas luteoviolacea]AOT10604.1 hypothetical protein S4054249_22340 [Pseudoalteromonas luteoviolacea]AOT15328.1 hypothetical protein S40542_21255 [Pseudoalteromonas luteoviolacea]AOT20423.1 hypothetical protein S4054_22255 [Pseudoalteromonas luteoviolacea]KKE83700.1 hypothetical protein N479_12805 [Pseudoalteromonas luteoviolacea S4054]KZN71904.1 hypothetical protein N481_17170 [Pseudoalteromonas luteoviolacea S4047-1]
MVFRHLIYSLSFITLVGCNSLPNDVQKKVENMTDCEKVNALITGAGDGFSILKGSEINGKLMKSWRPKAHLIENSCQINLYTSGNTAYECNKSFSGKTEALVRFEQVNEQLKTCLSPDWEEKQHFGNESSRSTFTSELSETKVAVNFGTTLDKQKPWAVSLEIVK